MKKYMIGTALLVAFTAPVLAGSSTTVTTGSGGTVTTGSGSTTTTTEEFYVVRNPTTKECTVTTSRPASSTTTVMVGNTAFKTRNEAEAVVTKECR